MAWSEAQTKGIAIEERPHGRRLYCFADRPKEGLWAMVARQAEERPDAEALVLDEKRVTYAEFARTAAQIAANLCAACGIGKGTRVALLMGNCLEFAYAFYACQRLGAIAVPLNTRLQRSEMEFMLNHTGSRVLIGDPRYLGRLDSFSLPHLQHRYAIGPGKEGYRPWANLVATGTPIPPAAVVDEDDPACILFTSGTTGLPKGAVLTHFNFTHTLMHYVRAMHLTAADRSMIAVPMFHVTGLAGQLLLMVYVGGCAVIMPEFKADQFITVMERERCTHTIVVPTIYVLCLMNPKIHEVDLPHWRIAAYGGAPMPESTIAALAERFPDQQLFNAYGSTETTSPATINPPPESSRSHSASVGIPVMCCELRVVGDEDRDVLPGAEGELLIKGPMVVSGYWENEDANRKSFAPGGYWRSGDIARIGPDGYVYILDRKKDMISRGGFKIYCAEVENVLCQHPSVLEAAVVGVADPVLGERVKAVVVPQAGCTVDPESIRSFCAERLAGYKVPEHVEQMDALPRNPGGKVLKHVLRGAAQ